MRGVGSGAAQRPISHGPWVPSIIITFWKLPSLMPSPSPSYPLSSYMYDVYEYIYMSLDGIWLVENVLGRGVAVISGGGSGPRAYGQ